MIADRAEFEAAVEGLILKLEQDETARLRELTAGATDDEEAKNRVVFVQWRAEMRERIKRFADAALEAFFADLESKGERPDFPVDYTFDLGAPERRGLH